MTKLASITGAATGATQAVKSVLGLVRDIRKKRKEGHRFLGLAWTVASVAPDGDVIFGYDFTWAKGNGLAILGAVARLEHEVHDYLDGIVVDMPEDAPDE